MPSHHASARLTGCVLDVKITPGDTTQYGAGLFDYPTLNFIVECAIFLGGLWFYTMYAPPYARAGYLNGKENRLWTVIGVMIAQQAHFCFGS